MTTSTQTSKQRPIKMNQPLKTFFSRYSKFQYQPRNSPIIEFKRLCEEYRWTQDSAEKKTARSDFNDAIKKEFDSLYGSDEKNINNWYKLCHVLRIDPVPNTLKECRADVSRKHVNLVDLVQGSRENIPIFESEIELSEYTKKTEKFFPKEDAADGERGQLSQPQLVPPPVESIPFEGSNSFQAQRGCTRGLGPLAALPYHVIPATYFQVQLAHQYTALMLQPFYPVHHLSQPRPSGCTEGLHYNDSHDPA
ncbi:hypothetical protein F5888DRAFT_1807729 [Russula emetica]|nr:hypothetical protein F5888DRAFT_1807729 [Russula emetica]